MNFLIKTPNTMKNLFFLVITLALCSCTSNKYVIEGNLEGINGYVYLNDGNAVIDSAAVTDGAFRFEGAAETPSLAYLTDSRERSSTTFTQILFLEPGTILVKGGNGEIAATGTASNNAYNAYDKQMQALIREYRDSATTDERRSEIEKASDALDEQTFAENSGNLFGIVLLNDLQYNLSGKELQNRIALFPESLQKNSTLTKLSELAVQKSKCDPGQPYMNIMQCDAEGNIVTLASVVDKPANQYVLVDFWASWCGPCMGEVPHLKQTYDEFHDKGFEIYGVSFDKDKERWLGAVSENSMNWIQVSDLNGFDNPAARDYAVQGIPSNFLIDNEGIIIATNLRGDALYEKVAELLK